MLNLNPQPSGKRRLRHPREFRLCLDVTRVPRGGVATPASIAVRSLFLGKSALWKTFGNSLSLLKDFVLPILRKCACVAAQRRRDPEIQGDF